MMMTFNCQLFKFWLIKQSINWLIDRLINQSHDWPNSQSIDQLINLDRLINQSINWSNQSINWSVDHLTDHSTNQSIIINLVVVLALLVVERSLLGMMGRRIEKIIALILIIVFVTQGQVANWTIDWPIEGDVLRKGRGDNINLGDAIIAWHQWVPQQY